LVFLPELADKDGNPAAYIIQKSGGGFLYSTTDLAAIRHRCGHLAADRTLILTDARQALHFKQTELVARKAGYMSDAHHYQHCPFGMMLGKDGKPFKTRSGDTIKLADLLDEAIDRAAKLLAQRNIDAQVEDETDDSASVASVIGIGAIKYADLSKNRTTDYIFDWDTMLSFEGNTAPYLQYAYTRIRSIFRKAEVDMHTHAAEVVIENISEHSLAVKLLQFEDTLRAAAHEATPHLLCTYLYELASMFMKFYEASPILKTGVEVHHKQSRLTLSALSAKTLKLGLDILGIETLEKM